MVENLEYLPPEQQEEEKKLDQLEKQGGILYEEQKDPETNEILKIVNILGVEVETDASKEEVENITKEIILSELDQELLRSIAESYVLRQPLLVEGPPGSGKTFLMKKFAELVHGSNEPYLELTGTPRTSDLEIMGHWAPKEEKEEKDKREKKDEKEENKEDSKEIGWEFKKGALLEAYSGNNGEGRILIVDEFNLITSNHQQAFLQIGGKEGGLSDSVSYWGNTGEHTHLRGKNTWVCFASNFPEETPGRGEVVAPMTDRLTWKTISQQENAKKKNVLEKTAGGRLGKRTKETSKINKEIVSIPVESQLSWASVLDERLGEQIADIVSVLSDVYEDWYQKVGDTLPTKDGNGGERRRTQKMEMSGRNALRLFSYLDHFQVRDSGTGIVDFTETLRQGFKRYYTDRIASSEGRDKLTKLFEETLTGVSGEVKYNEETITRKDLLDRLTTEATLPPEKFDQFVEKQKVKAQKKEEEVLQERKMNVNNIVNDLVNNSDIPDSVKEKLTKKKGLLGRFGL